MKRRVCRLAIAASCAAAALGLAAASAQAAVPTTTLSASSVKATSAVLNGTIDTGGNEVLWQFQYGTSTMYGKTTPAEVIPAGSDRVGVGFTAANLRPNTKYHFRLVTTQESGSSAYGVGFGAGNDVTFTTKKAGRLTLGTTKLTVHKGIISVPLSCASTLVCRGKLTLTMRVKLGKHFRTLTIAGKTFTIRSGRRQTVKPRLSHGAISRLRRARHHRLGARLGAKFSTGQPSLSRAITLTLR
jgi:hypothetical protein